MSSGAIAHDHLDFLTPAWLVSELMPVLRELTVEFTIAHMGPFPAKDGPAQRGFQEFLKLVGDGSQRCSVKLTGIDRFSTAPGFADRAGADRYGTRSTDLGQRLPASVIPRPRVGTIELCNMFGEWTPDRSMHKRILVDNPARLFGFK